MDTQFIYTVSKVEVLIHLILSVIFCVLSLFVLVHYIRRRYKLYKEINRIPQELLIKESYKNHLKNLKIKCIINNFIIIILIMEIIQSFGEILVYFPSFITHFIKETEYNTYSLHKIQKYSFLFYMSIYVSFVPVLSMLMDFLWWAYRKYEYKHIIMRWTWYIVIRALVALLLHYFANFIIISLGFQSLVSILYVIIPIIDFIQYVYYARKFYLHLKSREKEIRLFYFNKEAYLDSKYLRIHFKIATIFVGIALLFSTLGNTANLFTVLFFDIQHYIYIPQHSHDIFLFVYDICIDLIVNISLFISEVLLVFNYLYIFIVVVYKYYRDGQKLKNINHYIKPIMKQYHETYYKRYTNYA